MNRIEQVHADTGESDPAGVLAIADLSWVGRALREAYWHGKISIAEYTELGSSLYADCK